MKKTEFLIENQPSMRVDKYLASQMPDQSRSSIQLLMSHGDVLVNDEIVKASYLIQSGDEIEVTIHDPINTDILAQDIPLDIVYEDEDVIVVNKPSGMVVHPASGNYDQTLVNALMFHCKDLSGINGIIRAGIVHRIDKDTSGLLVACKNDQAHRNLSDQFANKTVTRTYYAIVYGSIPHNLGKIDAPIGRSKENRQMMAVVDGGKKAVTHFRVLERYDLYTLVQLQLETGRTHQIRVHMKYIGYPVVGDPVYGPRNVIGEHGQFLHAKSLGFIHPTKKTMMEFDSELPSYFQEFLLSISK